MQYSLDNKSYYSIGQSLLSPADLVRVAKEAGFKGLALTDHMTINGMPEFFKACAAEEMKGIIGCKLDILAKGQSDVFTLDVYVKNKAGMHKLMHLLSTANANELHKKKPAVPWKELQAAALFDNLLYSNSIENSLFKRNDGLVKSVLHFLGQNCFAKKVVPISTLYKQLNVHTDKRAEWFANKESFISHQVLFETPDQKHAMDLHRSICTPPTDKVDSIFFNQLATDKNTPAHLPKDCLLTGDLAIAKQCDYVFEPAPISLPKLYDDEDKALHNMVMAGFNKRLYKKVFGFQPEEQDLPKYRARVDYELGVIKKMNFNGYFLTLAYMVGWAKEQNILVGFARGSAAGSLVAYLLGITDVNPLQFGLIFERFLNEHRNSYPDIDCDFQGSRRQEVLDHMFEKFGAENCAYVSNFNFYQAAGAIRSVGRAYGLKPFDMTAIKDIKINESIEVAIKRSAQVKKFADENPKIIEAAKHLQGKLNGKGQHAAGFVVAGAPIKDFVPVDVRKGHTLTAYDKRSIEEFGLIKLDALGITSLDVVADCIERIGKDNEWLLELPLDDEETLELFSRGKTTGVFQFESSTARRLLREISVDENIDFENISNINAGNRPGALDSGATEGLISVRTGMSLPFYKSEMVKPALEPTGGNMIFQEQILKIAADLAGFSLSEADVFRAAIGKKNAQLMSEQKDKFVTGAMQGQSEVKLEDGSKIIVHNLAKHECSDGSYRNIAEIIDSNCDVLDWSCFNG